MQSNVSNYTELNDAGNQIHLLRLLPAKDMAPPISVELYVSDMEGEDPQYEALSYCWGTDMSTNTLNVGTAGAERTFKLSLTSNLDSALRHLRRSDRPRTLWIDSVCINQGSIEERNQQVQLMDRVHLGAERVVIWLGVAENDSDHLFELLEQNIFEQIQGTELPRYRQATFELCSRPWFQRVWVVQEMALAQRDPEVVCGSKRTLWSTLMLFLEMVNQMVSAVVAEVPSIDAVDGSTLPSSTNGRMGQGDRELLRVVDHALFLRDVRVSTAEKIEESWGAAGPGDYRANMESLPINMHRLRFSQATTRDKIYGFMGISAYPQPAVDYARETGELFLEAMMMMLRFNFQHSFQAFPLRLPADGRPPN